MYEHGQTYWKANLFWIADLIAHLHINWFATVGATLMVSS